MTRLAAIIFFAACLVQARVYTVQTSPDLKAWRDSGCVVTNNGEPAEFIRLVDGVRVSWTAVSNAVSYTVWMPNKFITTTNTFAYIQPCEYFLTSKDAGGNDSNPSELYQL